MPNRFVDSDFRIIKLGEGARLLENRMRKIWTVWDNWNAVELGAFYYEEQALKAKKDFIESHEDEDIVNDDIIIEAFTIHE